MVCLTQAIRASSWRCIAGGLDRRVTAEQRCPKLHHMRLVPCSGERCDYQFNPTLTLPLKGKVRMGVMVKAASSWGNGTRDRLARARTRSSETIDQRAGNGPV